MTRDGLQRTLIDLGWLALIQRALGGKPSSSYALYQLLRAAGRPVSVRQLAEEYAAAAGHIGRGHVGTRATHSAVVCRIRRLRDSLADLGAADVIRTVTLGQCSGGAYRIAPLDVRRVEAAVLFACGFELDDEAAA